MTGWSRLRKRSALVCQSTCLSSAAGREKRKEKALESDIRKVYFHFLSLENFFFKTMEGEYDEKYEEMLGHISPQN